MAEISVEDVEPARSARGVLGALDSAADLATGALIFFAAVIVFSMVVTRYIFSFSDPSVEIIARYAMIWGTFIGVACAVRRDIHIRFSLIEELLPSRPRRIFMGVSFFVAALFAAGIGVSGYGLVAETIMFGEVMPTELRWPVWIFNLAVPVGGALLALQLLRQGIANLWLPGDG